MILMTQKVRYEFWSDKGFVDIKTVCGYYGGYRRIYVEIKGNKVHRTEIQKKVQKKTGKYPNYYQFAQFS